MTSSKGTHASFPVEARRSMNIVEIGFEEVLTAITLVEESPENFV